MIVRTEKKKITHYVVVDVLLDAVIYQCSVELHRKINEKVWSIGNINFLDTFKISKKNRILIENQIKNYYK